MKIVKVIRTRDQFVLFNHVEVADTLWTRFLGLQFRKHLGEREGLLLVPDSSIHMLFMRMSIDAIFLDAENRVIKIAHNLKPWRSIATARDANKVLEVCAGQAAELGIRIDDNFIIG